MARIATTNLLPNSSWAFGPPNGTPTARKPIDGGVVPPQLLGFAEYIDTPFASLPSPVGEGGAERRVRGTSAEITYAVDSACQTIAGRFLG